MTSALHDGSTGSPRSESAAAPPVLRRTKQGRAAFGVAGGLARYFGVDVVLVRVAFVLLTVFGGSGLVLYVVGVLAIPEEAPGDVLGPAVDTPPVSTGPVVGGLLIVVGLLSLLDQAVPLLEHAVPVLLVTVGVLVLVATRS